jgi:biopolymer transport protein ExbD
MISRKIMQLLLVSTIMRINLESRKNDAEKLAQILGAEERKEDEEYRVLLLTDGQATHSKLTELLGALKEGKIHFPEKKETVELKERIVF